MRREKQAGHSTGEAVKPRLDLEDVEEVFSSKGRIRILSAIAESGEVNISQLARRVGMNNDSVVRDIARGRIQ